MMRTGQWHHLPRLSKLGETHFLEGCLYPPCLTTTKVTVPFFHMFPCFPLQVSEYGGRKCTHKKGLKRVLKLSAGVFYFI